MPISRSLVLALVLVAAAASAAADRSTKILGQLQTISTPDSLHVDFDLFLKDQVDSLTLVGWEPVRIFSAAAGPTGVISDTLRVSSLFIRGEAGLFSRRLRGRQSWPRQGRNDPARIWLEYGVDQEADTEADPKRKFWELNEFSVGFTVQPLVIIGSSFHHLDPRTEGLEKQSSYRESAFLGLHANYGRWRLTLAEGGAAGHFWGEADSTQQTVEFATGVVSNLRYDLGDLQGFRPVVAAGWHFYDFKMNGPSIQGSLPEIAATEKGLGLTVGVADPAGSLTYTYLDMDHFRHRVELSLPVISFKRSSIGTRIDYVQVDGRPTWKTHFLIDFSTPIHPKDGPLLTPQVLDWTWRNYAALAVACAAEPVIVAGAIAYLAVKGITALF